MWEVTIEGRSQAKLLKFAGVPVAKFYAERLTLADMFRLEAELNNSGWKPNPEGAAK